MKDAGADMLRGGAFKARTGPHTFQGLREEGLRLLALARKESGLPVVTEVMNPEHVERVSECADLLQVGTRNMQNFDLLKELGKIDKPILLKRGMSATIEEFLAAAEYILTGGNPNVILCERGIRTFETATGKRSLVSPMAKAALVAGAHGMLVEVHPEPEKALSDGPQSLTFQGFEALMREIKRLRSFLELERCLYEPYFNDNRRNDHVRSRF